MLVRVDTSLIPIELIIGLKLIASALSEDLSALSSKEVGFSRDLYVNGVEYILRGLPRSYPHTFLS